MDTCPGTVANARALSTCNGRYKPLFPRLGYPDLSLFWATGEDVNSSLLTVIATRNGGFHVRLSRTLSGCFMNRGSISAMLKDCERDLGRAESSPRFAQLGEL